MWVRADQSALGAVNRPLQEDGTGGNFMSIDTAFTHFPVLTTSRLHLRQIRPEDAEAFFAIKSDQDVADSYAQAPHQTLDDTCALIQRIQGYYDQRDSIFWSITLQGEDTLIGACSLWNFDSDFNCAEIGYELHQAYWGRGVMSEALSAILTCG